MEELFSKINMRVVGVLGRSHVRMMMLTGRGEVPMEFSLASIPTEFRMPNTQLTRVIEHMSGRQWLETGDGTVIAVLSDGYSELKRRARPSSGKFLNRPLKRLLDDLDRIASRHEEVMDTDVRERMSEALRLLFLKPDSRRRLPQEFGMFSATGNKTVREALATFMEAARAAAVKARLKTPQSRLDAFQNIKVKSLSGNTYDDYFGHCDRL
jgi:hypothetical protein